MLLILYNSINCSETLLVYPKIEVGFAALSVEINIRSILFFLEISHRFFVPKILLLTADNMLSSRIFTCLYAAA